MLGDVELDDIQVVEVTGKKHRDRKPKPKSVSCDCGSSLRLTTILIVALTALVVIICLCIGVALMFTSLEQLDVTYSNTSVNRLAMMIMGDMEKMRQYIMLNGFSTVSGYTLRNYSQFKAGNITEAAMKEALHLYITQQVYPADMWTLVPMWATGSENNYMALLDLDFETVPGTDFFHPGNESALCTNESAPPPKIKAKFYKNVVATDTNSNAWMSVYVPDDGDTRPMMICLVEVTIWGEDDGKVQGYLVYGRNFFPRLNNGGSYVDDVPTCVTVEDGREDAQKWDETDNKKFDEVVPGVMVPGADAYGGLASFAKRDNATVSATKGRMCPNVPLFNSTSSLMVGYMKLCGLDPSVHGDENCIKFRVDRPTSFMEEGTAPVVKLSVLVVAMMIVISIIFVIFLDCVVLRRIEKLSKVIRSQTRGHAKAQEEDESSVSVSVRATQEEEGQSSAQKKHGKSGRSSNKKSGTSASGTNATSDSSGTNVSGPTQAPGVVHDELGTLKRAMEQNAAGLRKRLEGVNDAIKIEQQKLVHHRQAMQLLNLWCGRKDYFPGLRPDTIKLRYEPTRTLDDLLYNSLALEYLKAHCDYDRTVENVWFILDVEWLEELETAEDEEKNSEKRSQLHDVVLYAAKNIVRRYIAKNAPQQINLSAETFRKLREVGERYSRKMFEEAANEVKLMLNTDILPRFQKTSSYSAMSETLYINNSGGGDSSSELSDETVSTAGSILTDEEEEGGVGHVFAKTFKNLHAAFDAGHDSSSRSGGSSHNNAPIGQAGEVRGTIHTSSKKDASGSSKSSESSEPSESSESSESSDKKEPQKVEDDKKEKEKEKEEKEEPKKEESESSESSSPSISSDSVTESSSSE